MADSTGQRNTFAEHLSGCGSRASCSASRSIFLRWLQRESWISRALTRVVLGALPVALSWPRHLYGCAGEPVISSPGGNSERLSLFCRSKVADRTMTKIECTFERSFPNGGLTSSRPRFDCLRIGQRLQSRSSRRPRETSSGPTMGHGRFHVFDRAGRASHPLDQLVIGPA